MEYARAFVPVQPYSSAGVKPVLESTGFATLANATTYYYELGGEAATLICAQLQAAGTALVATITIEDCVYPGPLVSNVSTTIGDWIPENPPTAFVATVGAGWVATAATVAVAGGAIGGCMYNIGNEAGRRVRMKVVVTTGDSVRVGAQGKA